jgi:hypothetical protein
MTSLVRKIVRIDELLTTAGIPHAFGGAFALAYHTREPRGTIDIDVNIFVPASEISRVADALSGVVQVNQNHVDAAQRDDQVRVMWGETPIDIFFNVTSFHDDVERHVTHVDFRGRAVPILSAVHLAVFKALFNRTKDWADVEGMVTEGSLDVARAVGLLVGVCGVADPRVERLASLRR